MGAPVNAQVTGPALETAGFISGYNAGTGSVSPQGLALVTFGFLTPDSQIWAECDDASTSWSDCVGVTTSWGNCL